MGTLEQAIRDYGHYCDNEGVFPNEHDRLVKNLIERVRKMVRKAKGARP